MQHRFKSALGVILALALILSFMPAAAFAVTEQTGLVTSEPGISAPADDAQELPEESPPAPVEDQPSFRIATRTMSGPKSSAPVILSSCWA